MTVRELLELLEKWPDWAKDIDLGEEEDDEFYHQIKDAAMARSDAARKLIEDAGGEASLP
jgi:hypothetical protein